jgi:hypothetical protein
MDVKHPVENPAGKGAPSREVRTEVEGVKRRRRKRRIDFQVQRERRRVRWQLTLMLIFIFLGGAVLYFVLNHLGR